MADEKKRMSGYARKRRAGLVPGRYSALYKEWRSAVTSGRRDEAERLGRDHSHRFVHAH